jgi:transcriptional regulator with XRE-family HTH domain
VAVSREPNLRSRWLGQQLKEMRELKRLTLKEVAAYAQRDASSLSRMESGIHPARIPEVLAYFEVCEVSDDHHRQALIQLAKDARETGWWDDYAKNPGMLTDRIWLESRAAKILSFQSLVIPGHLQTPRYAKAVIKATDFDVTPERANLAVEVRMQRQERIDANKALFIDAILDESLLHRVIGDPVTMIEQLGYLLERADRPDTQIRILPWSAGAHCAMDGVFDVIKLTDPYPPGVGYAPSVAGAIFIENKQDVERLEEQFGRLAAASLTPQQSKQLISEVRRRLPK